MLEASIPLLTPEYIEQLNSMVVGIMQQNKRKLQESFNNIEGIQNSSILSLYNLTIQEWVKKQKIIDNLCHFCLTMMSTVQILWEKRQQSEQKVSNSNLIIENLKKNIEILNEQNQHFKLKINQAETHIQSISGEKERIQQIYRSQSCIDFSANECFSELNICCKKNSEILENSNDRELALKQKDEILMLKQGQISSLIEEKSELQKKIEELYEQNQLYRIEVQLAEIAVKDALSYKSVSITNKSQLIDTNKDDYFATQGHRNGEIQCFSNSNESYILNKNILDYELSSEQKLNFFHYPSSPFLNHDILNDNSCLLSTESQCENLRTQRAFKRKNNFDEVLRQKLYTEQSQYQISKRQQIQNIHGCNNSKRQQLTFKKSQINPFNLQKKTVSLQCNLLKNVPKLNFFIKPDVKSKNKETSIPSEPQNNSSQSFTFEKTSDRKVSNKMFSNKKAAKDLNKSNLKVTLESRKVNQLQQQNSLSKLYNMISTKLVTQRIKGIKGK